jgi:peptidoglycan/LPS O-acetylase OafA/YrhL
MWMVSDAERSTGLSVLFFTSHIFRMTTFFIVAGFFARMMFHRRGLKGFARDRGKRIVLPLVAGWFPIFALIVAATIAAAFIKFNGPPPFGPPPPNPNPPLLPFPLTHLWFLYVLTLFYVVGVAVRELVARLDGAGRIRNLIDSVVALLVRTAAAPLVLAIPLALALANHKGWAPWAGIPTPDSSLIPNLPAFVGYGVAFSFGWILQRQVALLEAIQKAWPLYLAAALALTVAALAQAGLTPPPPKAGFGDVDPAVFAATYAAAAWTWSFAFIALAMRFLSGFSAWRRYLADASYWLYLIHLPLVILFQGVVAKYALPAELKYAAIMLVIMPLMLWSYQTMVRYTWLGAILNGKRLTKPGRDRIPSTSPPTGEPA